MSVASEAFARVRPLLRYESAIPIGDGLQPLAFAVGVLDGSPDRLDARRMASLDLLCRKISATRKLLQSYDAGGKGTTSVQLTVDALPTVCGALIWVALTAGTESAQNGLALKCVNAVYTILNREPALPHAHELRAAADAILAGAV